MKDVKIIIYEINNRTLSINIGEKNIIKYNNILSTISEEKIFEYLLNLFRIIYNWNEKYIDISVIDGNNWKLSIIYSNGNKKEYIGKSSYPNNFETFERLNRKLIDEVQNG